jgi:hypothetical protein
MNTKGGKKRSRLRNSSKGGQQIVNRRIALDEIVSLGFFAQPAQLAKVLGTQNINSSGIGSDPKRLGACEE